jgi:PleD family two-component response regulator
MHHMQECDVRDTMATSWRRLSDEARKYTASRGTRGGQPALSTAPVRILIVDDDIKSSDSLERMLHASGYSETRVAYSGHAALAIAAEFQPAVVLLELDLLDMSGYEVARLLRERAQSHDLRLIALTWSREHAGRELARVAGFERYLLKPVTALDFSGLFQMEGQ